MNISSKDWINYIRRMSDLCAKAGDEIQKWVDANGFNDREALIRFANALVVKYGEGSAELACQMYDAIADLEGMILDPAEPAKVATGADVGKAINGSLKQSPSGQLIRSAVQRLVKQAGADTTLQNAQRDGAQFAWIPAGDTCAFCLTLASRGWQTASKDAIKGGHASHIHSKCDCQYAIRFSENTNVRGYNPDKYKRIYDSYDGDINAWRRDIDESNRDEINEQKREAYARRNEDE